MLHAKKGPWFSCKKQGEIIIEGKKKKPHKQKEKKKTNKSDKITNAQLTTVLYLHCQPRLT